MFMPQREPLDAQLRNWLAKVNALTSAQQAAALTPELVRGHFAAMTSTFVSHWPRWMQTIDTTVVTATTTVPVRIYDPAPDRDKAVCLFFHGGGHMAGSIGVYDPICRKIAEASGQLVMAVAYRLAPEHPYPQGLEDCLAVARNPWPALAQQRCRVRRQLFVAGDSGGGAVAATISAAAQCDGDLAIERQLLIYPSLDYTLSLPSVDENGRGLLLDKARIQWYFDHYFQHNEDRRLASPLYQPLTADLPATLVITAGFCPLRDEGVAYVERLRAAGGVCEHRHFAAMIHAYLNLENLVPQACAATYDAIGDFLGER